MPRPQFTCVFAVLTLISTSMPGVARASFLRLVPTVDATVDQAKKTVSFKWTIKSEGDEITKDVELDFPQLNERHSLAKELAPNQAITFSSVFAFDRLGIRATGSYSFIYRILYKDGNFYQFSAPYVAGVTLPPAASRALVITLPDLGSDDALTLSRQGRTRVQIQNPLSAESKVDRVEPLAPLEIAMRIAGPTSFALKSQEEKQLTVELNRAGALPGSSYLVGMVISGEADGRHFTEVSQFMVEVRESRFTGRVLLGLGLAAVALAILSAWAFQELRKRRGKTAA